MCRRIAFVFNSLMCRIVSRETSSKFKYAICECSSNAYSHESCLLINCSELLLFCFVYFCENFFFSLVSFLSACRCYYCCFTNTCYYSHFELTSLFSLVLLIFCRRSISLFCGFVLGDTHTLEFFIHRRSGSAYAGMNRHSTIYTYCMHSPYNLHHHLNQQQRF